ncbi:molybdenum cofactor guanylyltransferase, partial [Chloroflexota bacterium]
MKIGSIILAGGKGLRLGREKALEIIDGRSLIQRVVCTLGSFSGDIIIV